MLAILVFCVPSRPLMFLVGGVIFRGSLMLDDRILRAKLYLHLLAENMSPMLYYAPLLTCPSVLSYMTRHMRR